MSSLILDRVPRILQGAGALEQIGTSTLSCRPRHVLLVADPGLKSIGMIEMR